MQTFAIVLLSFALATCVCAQDAAPTGARSASAGHIVTRTRTVAIFDDMERKLMTAIEKKDKAALDDLVAEDFEARRSSAPDTPEPRDQWLANQLPNGVVADFQISRMAVHLFHDDTAVVSMNYWQAQKAVSEDFFIVDVWTKHGDQWKLSVRYVSPAKLNPPSAHAADKKPTGKQ